MKQMVFSLLFLWQFTAYALEIQTKVPGTLSVVSYSEFKPISYGNGLGYEADLLKALAELWCLKINFYPEKTYEGIWMQPSKSYTLADLSIGGITPSKERIKQGALFSIGTSHFSQSLLVRASDYRLGRIQSYRSFKGKPYKIGVVPGTTGESYARLRGKEQGLSEANFITYPSEAELLPALKSGKIDAIARGEIGNEFQSSQDKAYVVIAKKNYGEVFSFALDAHNPSLKLKIDQSIQQITHKGTIGYSQWLANHQVFMAEVKKIKAQQVRPL